MPKYSHSTGVIKVSGSNKKGNMNAFVFGKKKRGKKR